MRNNYSAELLELADDCNYCSAALMRFEMFLLDRNEKRENKMLIPLSRPLQFLVIRHLTLQSSGPASSTNLSRLLVPDMSSVQS